MYDPATYSLSLRYDNAEGARIDTSGVNLLASGLLVALEPMASLVVVYAAPAHSYNKHPRALHGRGLAECLCPCAEVVT